MAEGSRVLPPVAEHSVERGARLEELCGWIVHEPQLSLFLSAAQGTMKSQAAGQVSVMATKACQLRHGTDPDEKPVVVVEFDTG